MSDFEAFWTAYPRKVGKLAAMNAYVKARRLSSAEDILAGVENYKRHPPSDPQYVCHASTFLSQGRWMDEYDEPALPASQRDDWYRECQDLHQGDCGGSFKHAHRMAIDRMKRESA